MVCEADANVVMAEVIPSRCLLISGLLAPASVLVVQDVVKLQHEARFVLHNRPANGCIPGANVAVHALHGLAEACAFGKA